MARQTNGTNQSLNSASTLSLSSYTKLVVAFWLLWDSFGTDDDLALEYSANYNNDDAFIIDPNSSV